MVHPDSELVGLDLDHCIRDGKFSEEAQEILDGVCSYSEISPVVKGSESFSMASCRKREEGEVILNAMTKGGT